MNICFIGLLRFFFEQEGSCQLLSLVFRIHASASRAQFSSTGGGGGAPSTLLGPAAATARQAVALAFDHAVLPFTAPVAPGSETRAGASGLQSAPSFSSQQLPPAHGGHRNNHHHHGQLNQPGIPPLPKGSTPLTPLAQKAAGGSSGEGGLPFGTGTRFGDVLGRESVALNILSDLVTLSSGAGAGAAGGGGGGGGGPPPPVGQQQISSSSPAVSPGGGDAGRWVPGGQHELRPRGQHRRMATRGRRRGSGGGRGRRGRPVVALSSEHPPAPAHVLARAARRGAESALGSLPPPAPDDRRSEAEGVGRKAVIRLIF